MKTKTWITAFILMISAQSAFADLHDTLTLKSTVELSTAMITKGQFNQYGVGIVLSNQLNLFNSLENNPGITKAQGIKQLCVINDLQLANYCLETGIFVAGDLTANEKISACPEDSPFFDKKSIAHQKCLLEILK